VVAVITTKGAEERGEGLLATGKVNLRVGWPRLLPSPNSGTGNEKEESA
jgi:hypothetical protein